MDLLSFKPKPNSRGGPDAKTPRPSKPSSKSKAKSSAGFVSSCSTLAAALGALGFAVDENADPDFVAQFRSVDAGELVEDLDLDPLVTVLAEDHG